MNIVAVEKQTNTFIESHQLGFDKGILIQNAKNAGFVDIEIKELDDYDLRLLIEGEHEASLTYADFRKQEYDKLNQWELVSDDSINGTTTHKDAILAIKAKYPKPI